MKNFYKLLSVLFLIFIIAACSKDDENILEPTTQNGGTTASSLLGQPIPSLGNPDNLNGIMATVKYSQSLGAGLPSAEFLLGFANFGNSVDAGKVSVNSNDLGKTIVDGKTFYMAPNFSDPLNMTLLTNLNFDGSNHSWTIAGGNGIPELNGSVKSPNDFSITAPADGAMISKSNGIEITWTTSSGETNTNILVLIVDIDSESEVELDIMADDGSHKIATSELANISGEALIQVVKFTYASASSGGKDYYMIAEIINAITVTIN